MTQSGGNSGGGQPRPLFPASHPDDRPPAPMEDHPPEGVERGRGSGDGGGGQGRWLEQEEEPSGPYRGQQ